MIQASHEDFVGVYKNSLSPDFCKNTIRDFELAVSMGLCRDRQQNDGSPKTEKQDIALFSGVINNQISTPIHSFTPKISEEFNMAFWNCFNLYADEYGILKTGVSQIYSFEKKVQRTMPGEGYHVWHCEAGDRNTANRVLAWILYLNDVEEGGETEFLYQHKRLKPEEGTFVFFPASFTHTHRGNPPLRGSKYIVTGWLEF